MVYGAILAGGTGTRMKLSAMPKQFLPLNGKPVIVLTLLKMLSLAQFDCIYIGIHPQWRAYFQGLLEEHAVDLSRVRVVDGGETRIDTITNVIAGIEADFSIQEADVIILHDAVRPFVTDQILLDSIAGAQRYGACVASIPAADTMLYSEDGLSVASMPNRQKLFHGQTPDSFNIALFKRALLSLTPEEKEIITGTAQIAMVKGIPIYMVPGDSGNFKITTDSDMMIAQKVVEGSL